MYYRWCKNLDCVERGIIVSENEIWEWIEDYIACGHTFDSAVQEANEMFGFENDE